MVATTAKVVQTSDDAEVSWFTLPGGTGVWNDNAGAIDDTIFGHTFSSQEAGLIRWTANANALYKGFAGYVAKLLKPSGAATVGDGEAFTLESGKIYKIDTAAREIWDRTDTVVVYDNAVDHTVDVEWIDYLFGRVKFLDAYSVIGPVTADISYFTMAQLGKGRTFTLTQTANPIDTTDFGVAQGNGGYMTFLPGLRTVALEIGGVYDVTEALRADLRARNEIIVEINPDGAGLSVARGFFRPLAVSQSGDVGALEEDSTTFSLNVPADDLLFLPFNWVHDPTTTLSTAIQQILTAFIDQTVIDVRYLYDGTNGQKGDAMVADVSLTGGLEVMNEFAANFQGSGVPVDVGTG